MISLNINTVMKLNDFFRDENSVNFLAHTEERITHTHKMLSNYYSCKKSFFNAKT